MKKLKILFGIWLLLMLVILLIDINRPKPINWSPTYALKDKIPFGLYVLDKEIKHLFPDEKIERFGTTPYEYFLDKYNYEDSTYTIKGNVLIISETNQLDKSSLDELIWFADHGNTIFLSMKDFPQALQDTLGFEFSNQFYMGDRMHFTLANKAYKNKKYVFEKGYSLSYFNKIDTLRTTVLGHQEMDTVKNVNFIKVPYGKGNFYLHTQPAAFSNYYLLKKNNPEYAANLLSYIPKGTVFWQAKSYSDDNISGSPMRYILSQPALRWAWYLSLLSIVIFMIFNAKRRQRIIPIKVPLQNTTVDFTKTIGNLYLQEGNHHLIIDKKIIYFLEKIRTDYLIDTFNLDETFVNRLQQKTGKDKTDIENVVRLIKRHRNHLESSEKDVIEISKAIEKIAQK